MSHTPGPWEAHQGVLADAPSVWDVTTRHEWSGGRETPKGWFVATVHEVTDAASAEANARLIASAPEMLEALEWIAANYENGHMNHVDFRVGAKHRADAAIAKAKGTAA